ncbi:MAG TPA: hypothetical protein VF407_18495 [Polyangiaceae bacterium]
MGTLGLVGLVGATGAAFAFFTACGFSPPDKNPNPSTGGGACSAAPGEFPAPDCDNSQGSCTGSGCPIDSKCGDPATCLPLADNASKSKWDFRMRRLNVAAPDALAEAFVQNTVVTANIDLKGTAAAPVCGDKGAGAFNWLLEVDKNANTLETGGAIPGDPFGAGYCFYNHTTAAGIAVAPAKLTTHFDASGNTFDTDPVEKLLVPIFLNGDVNNVIVLPLTNVAMKGVTLSDNDNCIGSFNLGALSSTCDEDPSTCSKWKTAGSLAGYITLEDADNVNIDILTESLCVLLTKATKDANGKCPRDGSGKLTVTGDYCSTTQSAGGCQDSYWLAATFAAAAVTINDGSTTPECQGGSSPVDAGQDSGSTVDSGTTPDAGDVDAGDGG